jgi:hypothetical protein
MPDQYPPDTNEEVFLLQMHGEDHATSAGGLRQVY